jgi:TetR/AcrR family transcriptional regulator, mexCD-oprJ operon repressor
MPMSHPARMSTLRERVAAAILDSAAGALAAGEAASMSDVATAAGVARATVYRYFPSREALLEALGRVAVEQAGDGLAAARLEGVSVDEAFTRAVRALVIVGDYFVVLARERARVDPAEFERRIGGVLQELIRRGQSSDEVRDDIPASWLLEWFIGTVVSALGAKPELGVEDTVDAITSLFLDGAGARDSRRG